MGYSSGRGTIRTCVWNNVCWCSGSARKNCSSNSGGSSLLISNTRMARLHYWSRNCFEYRVWATVSTSGCDQQAMQVFPEPAGSGVGRPTTRSVISSGPQWHYLAEFWTNTMVGADVKCIFRQCVHISRFQGGSTCLVGKETEGSNKSKYSSHC